MPSWQQTTLISARSSFHTQHIFWLQNIMKSLRKPIRYSDYRGPSYSFVPKTEIGMQKRKWSAKVDDSLVCTFLVGIERVFVVVAKVLTSWESERSPETKTLSLHIRIGLINWNPWSPFLFHHVAVTSGRMTVCSAGVWVEGHLSRLVHLELIRSNYIIGRQQAFLGLAAI